MEQYPQEGSSIFNEAPPLVYAGFWERVGAAILDALILAVPSYLLGLIPGLSFNDYFQSHTINTGVWRYSQWAMHENLLTILLGWLYAALMESGPMQATLGKRALNIKVVNGEGQRMSFANASGRHFAKLISTIICCIGYLFPLWDARRQALHDKVANTFVVNA